MATHFKSKASLINQMSPSSSPMSASFPTFFIINNSPVSPSLSSSSSSLSSAASSSSSGYSSQSSTSSLNRKIDNSDSTMLTLQFEDLAQLFYCFMVHSRKELVQLFNKLKKVYITSPEIHYMNQRSDKWVHPSHFAGNIFNIRPKIRRKSRLADNFNNSC